MGLKTWFHELFRRSPGVSPVSTTEEFNAEMRRRTEAARERMRAERKAEQRADDKRQRQREEKEFNDIVEAIPILMAAAADQGLDRVVAMKLSRDFHYQRPLGNSELGRCDPEWLLGPAKAVYEFCVETDRNPTIEKYKPGVAHPFAIVIHW